MRPHGLFSLMFVIAGCHSPGYEAWLEENEKWQTTGTAATGTTAVDTGSDTSGRGTEASADAGTSAAASTSAEATATGLDTSGPGSTTGPDETSTGPDTSTTTGVTPFCGDGEVNTPFEECDVGTPDPDGPCTPTCQRARIIFVLSLIINGKLSGLQGADAYCRSQALKAQMADPDSPIVDATNFKALLPSSKETVFERHFHGKGPYRLVNGLTVSDSFDQLFSEPLQNPINVDEFRQTRNVVVVTGLTTDGDSYPGINFCNDWTGVKGSASIGVSNETDEWWVQAPDGTPGQPTMDCADNWALYCLEQQ